MAFGRNILILLPHGLRSDAIGDCRVWPLETPHLEKLAGRGLRISASSACPADDGGMVCLLTGLHARQHGHLEPTRRPCVQDCWAAQLVDRGYYVAGVGCIGPVERWLHEAVRVLDLGTLEDPACAYLSAMHRQDLLSPVQLQRKQRLRYGPFEPDRLVIDAENDIDGFIAREARMMLARMPQDRPWALLVMFSGPGNDLPPPTLYDGLVDPRPLEEGFTPVDFTQLNALAELDYPRILLQRLEPHQLGHIRADYLGRVSLLDAACGRLVFELSQRADRDRTWVVLTSDRGHLLGEHGLLGHRSFLNGALDVPIIVAPPMPVEVSEPPDALYSNVDAAATIVDLGGCDPPEGSAGRSLLQVIREPDRSALAHWSTISEFGRRILLRTDRYKIIFDIEALEAIGLYDTTYDPDEKENLLEKARGLDVLDALRGRLGEALLPLRAMAG